MAKDATGNGPFRPVTAGKAYLHYPHANKEKPQRATVIARQGNHQPLFHELLKGVDHMQSTRTYSAAETAAILGISKSTICRSVREGKAQQLKPIKLGEALRFPRTVIDALAPEPDAA
ncbi:helix-turn-helix domain-containing protein [Corynebacterium belfantii]|nr:helix-turn-helix domain-containing protein [Corynebacterium belfantii]